MTVIDGVAMLGSWDRKMGTVTVIPAQLDGDLIRDVRVVTPIEGLCHVPAMGERVVAFKDKGEWFCMVMHQ